MKEWTLEKIEKEIEKNNQIILDAKAHIKELEMKKKDILYNELMKSAKVAGMNAQEYLEFMKSLTNTNKGE